MSHEPPAPTVGDSTGPICENVADAESEANAPSWTESEIYYMKLALSQAQQAKIEGEVPVGCVFVHNLSAQDKTTVNNNDDLIVAEAFNQTNKEHNGTRHCELVCIDAILKKYGERRGREVLKECTLYLYKFVTSCTTCFY